MCATLIGAFASAPCAAASTGRWLTFADKTYDIHFAIPASWHVVPSNVVGVQADIESLLKSNQLALAEVYKTFIATSAAQTQLQRYFFQAFQYVENASIQPDFALVVTFTSVPYTKQELTAVSTSEPQHLRAAAAGTIITRHTLLKIPAGFAALIEGTQPDGLKLRSQFAIYFVAHGSFLWELSFRANASTAGEQALFGAIADRLTFS
jgi:hypothetical protein